MAGRATSGGNGLNAELLTEDDLMEWFGTKTKPSLRRLLHERRIPYIEARRGRIVTTRTAVNNAIVGKVEETEISQV